ncbi:translation initiation factor IF-2 [Candidatus Vondammii sp. HM_W22]|uniref:translation initiation factor IF-2 n=1 Tax=Candidatus Vondammii sp. HM_W22 TaxID=2687299 RepID=UPI001F12F1CF|nr:translation initiation factor IF-2 [Candidatus Vondammii sp. HM_W22]
MSDVTVKQLAEDVGIPRELLLVQLAEAGLKKTSTDDLLSEVEKNQLLAHLRESHGKQTKSVAGAKKITLKRRSISELLQPSPSSGRAPTRAGASRGGKTISVEVRRKRTLVRGPSDAEQKQQLSDAEAARKALDEQAALIKEREATDQARRDAEEVKFTSERSSQEGKRKAEEAEAQAGAEPAAVAAVAEEVKRKEAEDGEEAARQVQLKQETQKIAEEKTGKKGAHRKDERGGSREKSKGRGRNELHVSADKRGRRKGKPARHRSAPDRAGDAEHGFVKPTAPIVREIPIPENITVADLAVLMSIKAAVVIKELMKMGMMVTINQPLDRDTATLVVEELGHKAMAKKEENIETEVISALDEEQGEKTPRAPVVTIMGHVDHGKTSLLDHIRNTRVASGEAGGITQHIGAYHVETNHGMITFLDTPGHAAFSAMRSRGAQVTDIVVLVVAADDGVKPQTIEAIHHSKASGVPMIVAVNKIDKPEAELDKIMQELSQQDVIPEEWGGDTMFIQVSAKTGQGIDDLLDTILLQAEVLELTAVEDAPARGVVVESSLDKGRGPVATILVQSGTLRKGDMLVCGQEFGRVRALLDENRKQIDEAGPSIPVEVLGLSNVPNAGDDVIAAPNERKARELAETRQAKNRDSRLAAQKAAKLDEFFASMAEGKVNYVNLIVKADVQGSVEALRESLLKITSDEVKVKVIAASVGGINESDVNLALTSNAFIIGFNVRADVTARRIAEDKGVDLRYYSIIYEAFDDVKQAISGMLSPEIREEIVGLAEVRDVFRSSKFGAIAGCMVTEGNIKRHLPIRVLRDSVVIYEGELESLRRHKDDASEVKAGTECGIGVKNYNDVKVGDQIEVFERTEIARTL